MADYRVSMVSLLLFCDSFSVNLYVTEFQIRKILSSSLVCKFTYDIAVVVHEYEHMILLYYINIV